jgi:D-alanyl-D-alanine carboxypeptidase/D-alanyl-D-alanine-endopeptidase (penicillin-binding protein 4)
LRRAATALLLAAASTAAADSRLIYHSEVDDPRRPLWSERADVRFNPASVLKVATSLVAIEKLGLDHRYATLFSCSGSCAVEEGRLAGDLVVSGGGDPDFHQENAWLVAAALNRRGIRSIGGDLVVRGTFWMGWEHGVDSRERDAARLALQSGERFREALDPQSWSRSLRTTWAEAAARMGLDGDRPPVLMIAGTVRHGITKNQTENQLLTHLSAPLEQILRRFNVFSNNDIVRIAEPLGGASAVQARLREIVGELPGTVEVSTTSGERRNRMTARQVLKLLWAFRDLLAREGRNVHAVLPIPGCDPGSIRRMFPKLAAGEFARTTVVKTGTLSRTDGGVAVLAGYFESADHGLTAYCVAAPSAGGALQQWRRAEQEWLLDLMHETGGPRQHACGPPLSFSEHGASIVPGSANVNNEQPGVNTRCYATK